MAGILDLVRGGRGSVRHPEYLAEDALEALVDAHLLESTTADRYKFHDLLRVYSFERAVADLSGQGRDAAVGRLLRWYMHTADAAATAVSPYRYDIPLDAAEADMAPISFATSDQALAWYDSERVNLVAATRQAAASGRHDLAWRLPAPLYGVFNRRGNWTDCIATNRIALDSARAAGNRQGEAWALNNLGLALGVSHESESISDLEQALAIRREIGDRAGEAQAANNLADAYGALGRWDAAVDLLQRALDLNRAVGPRYGVAVGLVNLGEALLHVDRAEEAVHPLQEARSAFAEIGFLERGRLRVVSPGTVRSVAGTRRRGRGSPARGPSQPPGRREPEQAGGNAQVTCSSACTPWRGGAGS